MVEGSAYQTVCHTPSSWSLGLCVPLAAQDLRRDSQLSPHLESMEQNVTGPSKERLGNTSGWGAASKSFYSIPETLCPCRVTLQSNPGICLMVHLSLVSKALQALSRHHHHQQPLSTSAKSMTFGTLVLPPAHCPPSGFLLMSPLIPTSLCLATLTSVSSRRGHTHQWRSSWICPSHKPICSALRYFQAPKG